VVRLIGTGLGYLREVLVLGLSVVECGSTVGQRLAGTRSWLLAWGWAPRWNIKTDLTPPRRQRYLTSMWVLGAENYADRLRTVSRFAGVNMEQFGRVFHEQ
jgi:hypothetical protein